MTVFGRDSMHLNRIKADQAAILGKAGWTIVWCRALSTTWEAIRLSPKGLGKTRPLVSNDNGERRAKNRLVRQRGQVVPSSGCGIAAEGYR